MSVLLFPSLTVLPSTTTLLYLSIQVNCAGGSARASHVRFDVPEM